MNVLVLGAGQVGKALSKIVEPVHNLTVMDLEAQTAEACGHLDVMHVCYPYSDNFVNQTATYIRKFQPQLTLIESTVKPHTTNKIYDETQATICHSPVRGLHSNLLWGLKAYTKFVGPCNLKAGLMAEKYYETLHLKTYLAKSPLETECAKLMNLSYFAAQIALFQEFERKRDKHGLNWKDVVHFFETTTEESNGEVPRPVFRGNHIGGTCVMQGLNMLFNPTKLAEWINHSNEMKK